jgi:predicted transport protein
MDHQAEFKLLVLEKFGKATADAIDWTAPRLVCIAADFTKYDNHAVQQMDRNIELIRYRQFGKELLLFELVNSVATEMPSGKKFKAAKATGTDKTAAEWLAELSPEVRGVFDSLESYLQSLGDDVHRKDLKLYVAFKRLRNFLTVCFQKNNLLLYLHLNPDAVELVDGFTRDVRRIGHWGTGSLEVVVKNQADLEKAYPLIDKAYNGGSDEG